jgi:hypothetical protein
MSWFSVCCLPLMNYNGVAGSLGEAARRAVEHHQMYIS